MRLVFSRPDPTLSQHTPLAWFFAWAFGGIDPSRAPTANDVRPDALHVLTQSYYLLPGPFSTLRALGVTHTHSGVAGKLILLAGATGQLLGIEKRLLDVRRVPREKWTQFEQEDGLLPYNASVYVPPRAALLARPVASLRFVRSAAARLESTTHVLAVGTDIMYTHACPAGPFDRLSPDFNRFALVATLAGLTVVTVILASLKRTPPQR